MDIPTLRKEFNIEIEIKKRLLGFVPFKRVIRGAYKQPTAIDIHDYFKNGSKFTLKFIKDFFFENTNIRKWEFKYIILKLDAVNKFLEDTYFEWLWNTLEEETDWAPFNSDIMWLGENDPEKYYWIINNLTIPQIKHAFDCKIWNINAETKEWEKRNAKIRVTNPEAKAKYDKMFAGFEKALKSKKQNGVWTESWWDNNSKWHEKSS